MEIWKACTVFWWVNFFSKYETSRFVLQNVLGNLKKKLSWVSAWSAILKDLWNVKNFVVLFCFLKESDESIKTNQIQRISASSPTFFFLTKAGNDVTGVPLFLGSVLKHTTNHWEFRRRSRMLWCRAKSSDKLVREFLGTGPVIR